MNPTREKIKSFLAEAIKQDMIANLEKRHHPKLNIDPVSDQSAETLIQEFENIIRSDTARVLDEKVEDLKSHITKSTSSKTAIFNNIVAAFLYSILLVSLLIIGNYTYPNLGKGISDFFMQPERSSE